MVSLMTFADRVVVEDSALRIDTTGARTWIKTLGANTGKVLRTVIVEQTFRFTAQEGITLIVSDTLAHSLATLDSTLCIGATWVGVAGILGSGWWSNNRLLGTPGEWITNGSWWTTTDGVVLSDLT